MTRLDATSSSRQNIPSQHVETLVSLARPARPRDFRAAVGFFGSGNLLRRPTSECRCYIVFGRRGRRSVNRRIQHRQPEEGDLQPRFMPKITPFFRCPTHETTVNSTRHSMRQQTLLNDPSSNDMGGDLGGGGGIRRYKRVWNKIARLYWSTTS